ncbi:MAG: gliding motility-associated C-terminal domain-containing protein, partial [Flavobacteriales bacterium]
ASHSGASYQWQDGSTDSTYTVDSAGVYWVEVSDPPCPGRRDSVELVRIVPPSPRLGDDTLICQREPIAFTIVSGPPDTVIWQDGTHSVTYEVDSAGTYTVYASNRCGSGSDTVDVRTEDCSCQFKLPNVFTPNGDGKNDRFAVRSEHCGVKNLRIYNRWGQMLYQQKDVAPSWNGRNPSGKKVPEGTYFYSVQIGKETHQGQVTLIRDED